MKREPLAKREQDSWLGTMLRRSPPTSSQTCLDAETLAAWADGALGAREAAAVELHASSCSRCMAVLAAMERTAPAQPEHSWAPARLFRWLVPLTAAATAIAIWIAVLDREVAQVQPAPAHDLTATSEPATSEPGTPNLEPKSLPQSAPSARLEKPDAQEQVQMRDEFRRERAAPEAFSAPAAAPAPEAPPQALSADTAAESVAATAKQPALNRMAMSSESTSPSNRLIRWRVVAFTAVERSTDAGKTWTKTSPVPGVAPNATPALTVVAVRAVDADRATVRTSDGAEFYTTNGGLSWTRVQENSAAPF